MVDQNSMSGRGILFVESKIAKPDALDLETYMKWYDDDHIPEIIQTSGIKTARRFVSIDPKADKPYLAMYAMDDIAFTQGEEFRNIRVKSDLLPPPGIIYDLADMDVRYDNLIHVYDPTKRGKGATKSLITAAIELDENTTPEEFERWYREEHCALIGKAKGFVRSTRFKLAYARTNAQSRVLKGLAPPTDEPPPTPATWLALHEFDCKAEDIDMDALVKVTATPWCEKMVASFSKHHVGLWNLAKEFGEKDWFHGVGI